MTVVGQFNYDIRPYAGYVDPGLPIGSYIAQGGLVGDSSGGNVVFTFLFQQEQEEQITELFNLEQLTIDTSAQAVQLALMVTVNMDRLSRNRDVSAQQRQFVTTVVSAGSALNQSEVQAFPIWLGSPNLSARAGTGGLRFSFANVDLRLYQVTIQGYIWGPRSVLAPGGPRRPVAGGLFG